MKKDIYMYKYVLSLIFFSSALPAFSQQSKTDTAVVLADVQVNAGAVLTNKSTLSAEASASPAAVTLVGRDYIAKQTFNSYGDLLRPLAGINVSNYQLGGVGYGIQVRGYVVTEHARDVAFFIDGVPQNQGSSIEANGYVDLSPLIPENLRRIEVIRGPFSPFYGDHALGGAISFETMDRMPSSIIVSGGTYGAARVVGTLGFGLRKSRGGYVSVEGSNTDGYRKNNGEKHLNVFAKYSFPMLGGTASVRAQVYTSNFNTAGYLNRVDVDANRISAKLAVNSSDGGNTQHQNLVLSYKGVDTSRFTSATIYVQHNDFTRIRTGVIGGAQREEKDNRTWAGFDLRRTRITNIGKMPVLYAAGIYFRADMIENGRYATTNGNRTSQNRDRDVKTYTPAAYAQLQMRPARPLKITLSARYDHFFYNLETGATDTDIPNQKSKPKTHAFSPKAGVALQVRKNLNIFFNAAQGSKSPSGYEENIYNAQLKPARLTSYEIGFSGDNATGRLHALVSAYISRQDNEVAVGPLGNLTNFGKTKRAGIEAEGRAVLTQNGGLALFANFTRITAKIRNGAPDEIYVTNTPDYFATLGFDYDFANMNASGNHLILSVYDQLIGPKNLNASGKMQSNEFHRLSGKLTYTRQKWGSFRLFAEGSYYPGKGYLDEVSFLSGPDLLTSAQAPATFRAGVRIPFN